MRPLPAIACLLACCPSGLIAGYREAMVIDNHPDKDVTGVVAGLEKYGFRCQTVEDLGGGDLEKKVSAWAAATPTDSTALVYFTGPVEERDPGKPALLLEGSNGSADVAKILDEVANRGGNSVRLCVIDSETKPGFGGELQPGSLFAYADLSGLGARSGNDADLIAGLASLGEGAKSTLAPGTTLAGMGSVAISPPDKLIPGKKAGDEWFNTKGMIFVWCPPGKYTAGSPEGMPGRFADEELREVGINNGFWIGKYEITGIQNLRNRNPKATAIEKNLPLANMHWDDGSRMAEKMMTEEEHKAGRLPDSWQYHLPSADQWEYAARAGTKTTFYFGDDVSDLPKHANFADKSHYDTGDIFSNYAHRTMDDGFMKLAPVGSFEPNPWGLHDVYGNVSEWCRDHAVLGGGWASVAENCRSAYRDSRGSRNNQEFLGYRWVIQPNLPAEKEKTK